VTSDTEATTSIFERASHWWELFRSGDASNSDHQEFCQWMTRSPEHVAAYLETARLDKALKSPALIWPSTPAEVLIREAQMSPAAALPFSRPRTVAPPAFGESRHARRRYAWAAGAAVVAIGVGAALLALNTPQKYTTALGEQRSVVLADGSRITLNTDSTLEVHWQQGRREVRLTRGEALFEVAHDPVRPFVVRAGGAILKDMGTQFNVDMHSTAISVTVVEGQVAVDSGLARDRGGAQSGQSESGGREALVLRANDRVVITSTGLGTAERGVDVVPIVAWTRHQLIFEHRPLIEVAEEFNRYNRDRIDIDSAELRRQEVTGVFEATDPASFLGFLAGIPGVEIRAGANGAHIVTMRKPSALIRVPQ
jgi:transmembrane sensor